MPPLNKEICIKCRLMEYGESIAEETSEIFEAWWNNTKNPGTTCPTPVIERFKQKIIHSIKLPPFWSIVIHDYNVISFNDGVIGKIPDWCPYQKEK